MPYDTKYDGLCIRMILGNPRDIHEADDLCHTDSRRTMTAQVTELVDKNVSVGHRFKKKMFASLIF